MKQYLFVLALLVSLVSISAAQVPAANHVFVVVLENHGYSSMIGNSNMPYFNYLASKYGLATQYYANTHPSIGNYFMMTTGQIITNNDSYNTTVTADNIVRHLLTGGKTWKSYAESLPYTGYTGWDKYPYVKHHNPFAYFSDVANSSAEKLNLVPFTQFAADLANNQLPQFSFLIPNMHDDGHDCPAGMSTCADAQKLAAADDWLKTNLTPLLSSAIFQNGGLLVIDVDEAATSDTAYGGGRVATIVVSPKARPGYKSTTLYQHQSLLRTVLTASGVTTFPGAASTAKTMSDFFEATSTSTSSTSCPLPSTPGVKICTPTQGMTSGTPVSVRASSLGYHAISATWVYVDNVVWFKASTNSVSTSLGLAAGTHTVTVKAWDTSGALYTSTVQFNVN